jgi:hypothetical protein
MRKAFYLGRGATFSLFLTAALWVAAVVWAKDWHELQDMSDIQLAEKISEFQEKLHQNPADYEMLKAMGIAFHVKADRFSKLAEDQ